MRRLGPLHKSGPFLLREFAQARLEPRSPPPGAASSPLEPRTNPDLWGVGAPKSLARSFLGGVFFFRDGVFNSPPQQQSAEPRALPGSRHDDDQVPGPAGFFAPPQKGADLDAFFPCGKIEPLDAEFGVALDRQPHPQWAEAPVPPRARRVEAQIMQFQRAQRNFVAGEGVAGVTPEGEGQAKPGQSKEKRRRPGAGKAEQ